MSMMNIPDEPGAVQSYGSKLGELFKNIGRSNTKGYAAGKRIGEMMVARNNVNPGAGTVSREHLNAMSEMLANHTEQEHQHRMETLRANQEHEVRMASLMNDFSGPGRRVTFSSGETSGAWTAPGSSSPRKKKASSEGNVEQPAGPRPPVRKTRPSKGPKGGGAY